VDLSQYDARCTAGVEGWTDPTWRRGDWVWQDRFWGVRFDNGASLPVLCSSLEVCR
jgi:hypothetical protein